MSAENNQNPKNSGIPSGNLRFHSRSIKTAVILSHSADADGWFSGFVCKFFLEKAGYKNGA
jgi:hypothetical protein